MSAQNENTPNGQGIAPSNRHLCLFPGCEKTFIRKEHLTRHESSHAPQRSFVCYVCQRGFTRNDILRRHITRHKNSARATARNGRACDGCHSSKIKCEGGQPCVPCVKRKIECKFERDEVAVVNEGLTTGAVTHDDSFGIVNDGLSNGNNSHNTSNSEARDLVYESSILPSASSLSTSAFELPTYFMPDFAINEVEMVQESSSNAMQPTVGPEKGGFTNEGSCLSFSDNTLMRGMRHASGSAPKRSIPKSVTKEHYELYLDQFHHRWPIIHIPTFEKGDEPYVLTASVEMIGAWLQGSQEQKLVGLTLHDRLTNHIFQRMYQKSSYAERYKPWPIPFFQAAFLNVVFGFYCGEEKIVSRAVLLCSMLISSLRDLGFFRSEIASLQEREATFYPYIMSRQEERKRLALALFKIDCYFSIMRGQPMTLKCEELYFPLQSTFSLFNGPGLHFWEARFPEEPVQRSQETVSSMISDRSFSSINQPFLLVEDIQLGICSSQVEIWEYSENIQNCLEHDINSLIQQKSIREGLNSWKRLFDQTAIEDTNPITQVMINKIPMKYYFGVEDHSEADWQATVLNRPRSLLFDTAIIYHLFSLHIHANVRNLEILASHDTELRRNSSEEGLLGKERRARQWTNVVCSRQAIWHASNIVALHRSKYTRLVGDGRVVNTHLDPIAYVALAVASLVVWAYCSFNEKGCVRCVGLTGTSFEVELLNIVMRSEDSERWIELGGAVTMDGHTLCQCNIDTILQIFRNCLPSGTQKWELAESLSGVLNKVV